MAAAGRALVLILALSWANSLPAPDALDFIENVRDVGMSRIVSGWEAKEGQIPYQLSIRMIGKTGGVSSCGATIIHSEWALTAAHCTGSRVTIVIRVGALALSHPELIFETTEFYNYPEYDESLTRVQPHDIGVIKFGRVLQFNDRFQPIRLQASVDKNKNYDNVRLQASGWGRTWTNGTSPEVLNWVYLNGVNNERCRAAFGGSSNVVDSTICAGSYNVTSQSTCQGDSGGPLITIDVDGRHTEVGVTSFVSSTGCHTGFPAGTSPEVLNWVYLNGVNNERCRAAFGGSSNVVDSTICAGSYNVTSQSTCQGDSGGPLITIDVDGRHTEVGVTSFVSSTGCHTGFPAGFIRPGHYHEWFTKVTGVDFDWQPKP